MTEVLLVRTPAQQRGESFSAYLLRVSEKNGYPFPRRIAQLAGVDARSMFLAKVDLSALARVLGRSVETLDAYSAAGANGSLNVRLRGQLIVSRELRPWTPALCIECVRDLGFIPAWSDLALVDACPNHNRRLQSRCRSCGWNLTWERRGLLRCKCGAWLSDDRSEQASLEEDHRDLLLDLLSAVEFEWSDARWTPRTRALSACRSLAGVLATVRALAKLHVAAYGDSRMSIARRAARVAAHWPSNLHRTLARLGPRVGTDGGFEHLSRHRHGILREFRKHLPAAELAFIRLAMNSPNDWAAGPELVPLTEDEPQAARPRRRRAPSMPRKVRRAAPNDAGALRHDEISKFSELPQSVMVYLRRTGHLAVRHQSRYLATFHESDVRTLFQRIQALPISKVTGEAVSLKDAMQMKLFFADGKGELVAAVLQGDIRVRMRGVGVNVMLHRPDVDEFCAEARRRCFGGAVTPTEAAEVLRCSHSAAAGLVKEGHVAGQHIGVRNVRLNADSLAEFSERFRSMVSLADELETSAKRLIELAQGMGIPLLVVNAGAKTRQAFIERRHADQLARAAART